MACGCCVGDERIATLPDCIVYVDRGMLVFEGTKWSERREVPIWFCPMCGDRLPEP